MLGVAVIISAMLASVVVVVVVLCKTWLGCSNMHCRECDSDSDSDSDSAWGKPESTWMAPTRRQALALRQKTLKVVEWRSCLRVCDIAHITP